MKNYKSATHDNRFNCEIQIKEELANGRYRVAHVAPKLISALGAIDKGGGKVRLIHDASRPTGSSINDFCDPDQFQYESLQNAVDLITPSCWMAKLDLSQAYRSVKIHPSNFPYTGLSWRFEGQSEDTILYDTRLCFGSSCAPAIFNELGQAVKFCMRMRGYENLIVYLDDFLYVSEDENMCKQALTELMGLLRNFGFAINYNKVVTPTKRIEFLGIVLDSNQMVIELPQKKIKDFSARLTTIASKQKVTKKELQSLAGKLVFATQCIYGGKYFLRRIYDTINKLKHPWHRTRVTADMREDIRWWLNFLSQFNGTMPMVEPRPLEPIFTDACLDAGGAVFGNKFVYFPWNCWPQVNNLPINYKEALVFELAVSSWAPLFANKKIIINCDNQAAVAIFNKGSSKEPLLMASLRRIFWYSAVYNFRLHAVYLPGSENKFADAVSRLHESQAAARWQSLGVYPVVHSSRFSEQQSRAIPDGPRSKGGSVPSSYVRRQHEQDLRMPPSSFRHVL